MSLRTLIASLKQGGVLVPVLRDYIAQEKLAIQQGKLSRKGLTIRDAKMTIRALRNRMEEFNHGEEIEGDYVHPSSLGYCMRALWFSYYNAPSAPSSTEDLLKSRITLETGTYLHLAIQNLCSFAKVLVRREVAIKDVENKILGHCDGIVKVSGVKYVLEIKSANSRSFAMTSAAPMDAHRQQAHCYMKSLELKWAIILYVNKDRGELKEYVIPFDKVYWETVCAKRITQFFKHAHQKTIPDREGDKPNRFPCSFCSYTDICFSSGRLKKFQRSL